MDDRKNRIKELEKSKNDNQTKLNSLLEDLGKAILSRPSIETADTSVFPDITEYHRLQKEIVDSEASIAAVETQLAHSMSLQDDIDSKEQQNKIYSRELAGFYSQMGKMVLEDPALLEFSEPYSRQADVLIPKVQSLEDRLSELTDKTKEGNIFSWIGMGTQGVVLKSFLSKAQENLERLYCTVGEQFHKVQLDNAEMLKSTNVEILNLGLEIDNNKSLIMTLSDEISEVKAEHEKINDDFAALGGSAKQIQNFRKNIGNALDLLKSLYQRFGYVASGNNADGNNTAGSLLDSYLTADDRLIIEDAARLRLLIHEDREAIKKIQASIDIDTEKEKIEKYRRSIAEKQARITEAQRNISDYEDRIKDAENYIEELQQLL